MGISADDDHDLDDSYGLPNAFTKEAFLQQEKNMTHVVHTF